MQLSLLTLATLTFSDTAWASTPSGISINPENSMKHITYQDALIAYEDGNKTLALVNAKIAGSNGNADAQVMVGHILLRGETGVIDVDDAAKWFRSAAEQNHPDAFVALGEMSLRSQAGLRPSHARNWLVKAANLGRGDAMRVLADMYSKGSGVPQDLEQSAKWLERANRHGDTRSARRMGDLLIETDPQEALNWYEKSAAKGDVEAAYIAALMYVENLDIRPNSQKAAILMRQAAEGGLAAAQADYGLLVYQGAGVKQNTKRAAHWFAKAAKGGEKEGQFLYAFTLAKGEGVEQSFEDAYYWLLKSGESAVDAYEKDRQALKQRLEDNVDPSVLARARQRFLQDQSQTLKDHTFK